MLWGSPPAAASIRVIGAAMASVLRRTTCQSWRVNFTATTVPRRAAESRPRWRGLRLTSALAEPTRRGRGPGAWRGRRRRGRWPRRWPGGDEVPAGDLVQAGQQRAAGRRRRSERASPAAQADPAAAAAAAVELGDDLGQQLLQLADRGGEHVDLGDGVVVHR